MKAMSLLIILSSMISVVSSAWEYDPRSRIFCQFEDSRINYIVEGDVDAGSYQFSIYRSESPEDKTVTAGNCEVDESSGRISCQANENSALSLEIKDYRAKYGRTTIFGVLGSGSQEVYTPASISVEVPKFLFGTKTISAEKAECSFSRQRIDP